MRVALYARFSSDLQNERSAADQLALCRNWAEKHGMAVVAEYRDEAVSGASTVNRIELGRLMRDARAKMFDAVLAEDLDRIARKQADLHRVRDELAFLGVTIHTVADGAVTAMHAGLKGLMSEMFLTDLANKTRRGQRARVTAGASGGGKSYGYRPVPGQPGVFVIDETEAAIVRRIFAEYVAGATPRQIVNSLNRDGIPAPGGSLWGQSTVNGSRERQNGILQNRLYIGERVWNRQRFIKNPATGKRVSRLNPESEWLRAEVPELQIVDADLFAQAHALKAAKGGRNAVAARKAPHLLSGLCKCEACGSGYTIIGRDRLGCSNHREKSVCTNNKRIGRAELEQRVLRALQTRLAAPELIELAMRSYYDERRRLAAENRSQRGDKQKRLAEVERAIARGLDAILDGTAPDGLGPRVKAMEAEAEVLRAELAELDSANDPVAIHPGAAAKVRRAVENLQAHIASLKPGAATDALFAEVRSYIDRVEVGMGQNAKEPATVTVYGLFSSFLVPVRGKVGCGSAQQTIPPIRMAG